MAVKVTRALFGPVETAWLIAAYGGLRLSEWRALRRSDLALIDGRYRVLVTRQAQYVTGQGWVVGPPKSAKGVRSVTLPTWMTDVIDAHMAERVGEFAESLLFAPKGTSEFIHDSAFNGQTGAQNRPLFGDGMPVECPPWPEC
ncbi:hypothetical protein ACFY9N_02995 [Microbacterium sp. NPDC008134]|uniref:hypothetical protein n=1 Tax=Microbacterium sp. NPDC008134 TaxID=3364183 RepID=UPI0036EC22EB